MNSHHDNSMNGDGGTSDEDAKDGSSLYSQNSYTSDSRYNVASEELDCPTEKGGAKPKTKHHLQTMPNGVCSAFRENAYRVSSGSVAEKYNHCWKEEKSIQVGIEARIAMVSASADMTKKARTYDDMENYFRNNVDTRSSPEKCPGAKISDASSNAEIIRNPHVSVSSSKSDDSEDENHNSHHQSSNDDSDYNEMNNDTEDDCYIYTYKGDSVENQLADLPSSFFRLDVMNSENECTNSEITGHNAATNMQLWNNGVGENGDLQRGSGNNVIFSPEMDFLEMDFDPGPLESQDSDSEENNVNRELYERELYEMDYEHGCHQPASELRSESERGICDELKADESNIGVRHGTQTFPVLDNHNCSASQISGDNVCDTDAVHDIIAVCDRYDTECDTLSTEESNRNMLDRLNVRQNEEIGRTDSDSNSTGSESDVENNPGQLSYDHSELELSTNNLGAASAPELSPDKEYFVQNQFVRSFSCQNQLSNPKYHNICLKPCLLLDDGDIHNAEEASFCSDNTDSDSVNLEACGEKLVRRENSVFNIQGEEIDFEEYNLQSMLYNCIKAKRLVLDKQASFSSAEESSMEVLQDTSPDESHADKVMIWSELEACSLQVSQIGSSACGATAVVNVMVALSWPFTIEAVQAEVRTRLRAENSLIPEYLFSRSMAGSTHEDLIQGIDILSSGSIYGRFFPMYPERSVNINKWLASWIKKGAVPVATLNLQKGVPQGQTVPDAWHHQMVFGVGPNGIFLTNPLECTKECDLQEQLCSEPVLLVRRADIISRWTDTCDLHPLMEHAVPRWNEMNVLGQVVNVLREAAAQRTPGHKRAYTQHVSIPAAYKSGITLFIRRDAAAFVSLQSSPELPLKLGQGECE